ncbi:unnamed protein product [Symbiodinium sp. CCMP2592]|nr:unnamed protein product [Symbiodinium sp. CCMP2592]
MERLKAGYEKFREAKGHLLNEAAGPVMQKFMPVHAHLAHARQHAIAGRSVTESRQISEGGFAFVWLVHDAQTNEEMVLKKIRCQDKSSFAMARREVQLLERLPRHPNLVQYFGDILLTEGKSREVGLLFEFCSGGHLLNFLDKHEGRLSEKLIVETLSEVVAGVAVLHSFLPPVQHRDLKVENVLRGIDGHWKLLDFGSWSDERLEPGSLDKPALSALQEQIDKYTTMIYRPPEMVDFFAEFPISEKVDVWMIGCILYTLMFYRHPFQDESPLAIANARYPWPSTPEHSEKLRDLTHWLLARDPSHRPDAASLLSLLVCFDEAEVHPPKAVLEKSEKFRRLYEPGKSCREPQSPSGSDALVAGDSERKRSKPHKHRQTSKKKAQAETPPDEGWPAAVSSELQWANFDGFHQEPSSAGSASPSRSEAPGRGAWAHFQEEPTRPMEVASDPVSASIPPDPWSAWSSPTHEPSTGSQSPVKAPNVVVKPPEHWAGRGSVTSERADAGWPLDSVEVSAWPEQEMSVRPVWDPTTANSPSRRRLSGAPAPDSPKMSASAWPNVGSPKAAASDMVASWPCASPWTNTPAGSPRNSDADPGSPSRAPWPVTASQAPSWPAEERSKAPAPPPDPWSSVLSPEGSPKASRHGQKPAFAWAAFD